MTPPVTAATLRFWGVRGSIPCPGPGTVRYGGNTSCVSIGSDDGGLLVLDAGTGIRALGNLLQATNAPSVDLLLSHVHWDHIQGLGFFLPLYDGAAQVRIIGPRQEPGLRTVLERLSAWENFPIPPSRWEGVAGVKEIGAGTVSVSGWTVGAFRLCHPGHTLGYRLERPGVKPVAYLPDNELAGNAHGVPDGWRPALVDFLRGVETLIHDATWTEEQRERYAGWGHSSSSEAVRLAGEAGCRRLVLFHHNPDHDDHAVDALLDEARAEAGGMAPGLEVEAAIEGAALVLTTER